MNNTVGDKFVVLFIPETAGNVSVPQLKNNIKELFHMSDEKVAALHLAKLGAQLTQLSSEQATYIGVGTEGPYKPEYYRY